MKKIIILTLLILVLFQCTKKNENVDPVENNETAAFSLNIGGNFFISGSSGVLYISNSDGDILGEGALANNQQTTVEIDFDPNEVYDASLYLDVVTNGTQFHFIYTYSDVPPGDYSISSLVSYNPNDDTITLNITNAGDNMEVLSTSSYMTVETNSNNGGTYVLSGGLLTSPGDYYISLKKPEEQFARYIWLESLAGNGIIDVDFETLPTIDQTVQVNFPSNEDSSMEIYGMIEGDPQGVNGIFHQVQYESSTTGSDLYEARIPPAVFDRYRILGGYMLANDENQYQYYKISEDIASTIPLIDLDFTINTNTISNFSMTTEGNFDFYETAFVYTNTAQNLVVIHDIIGKGATEISFSKANLFDNVFADDPQINSSVLPPTDSFHLTNYSQISSYSEFLQTSWLYGPVLSENETIESASR